MRVSEPDRERERARKKKGDEEKIGAFYSSQSGNVSIVQTERREKRMIMKSILLLTLLTRSNARGYFCLSLCAFFYFKSKTKTQTLRLTRSVACNNAFIDNGNFIAIE